MTRRSTAAFWVSFASLMTLASAASAQMMPAEYQGVWMNASEQKSCRFSDWPDQASDTHIRVGEKGVDIVEGYCKFGSVKKLEHADIKVRMVCQVEGETERRHEIWSRQDFRGHSLLIITRPDSDQLAIMTYQFCPKSEAAQIPGYASTQSVASHAFDALPSDIRGLVSEIRQRCTDILDELSAEDRGDLNYIPEDDMSGIHSARVGGRPAIVVDNFNLCTSDVPGANCTNRGCDLSVWLEEEEGDWRKVLTEDVQAPPLLHVDAASKELLSLEIVPQPDHPGCKGAADDGECTLNAAYREGRWWYEAKR